MLTYCQKNQKYASQQSFSSIMDTAVKLAMMIFSAFSLLIALAQSEARAYLLGYADNRGYLLYTDKLFDLHLTNPDSEGSEYIPMRIAFYTSPLYRKSILLNGYWSFPIFDHTSQNTTKI